MLAETLNGVTRQVAHRIQAIDADGRKPLTELAMQIRRIIAELLHVAEDEPTLA